jgi:hypothetical protein
MPGLPPKDYGTAKPYVFVPIAGTEWQDRFVNNFVDLDASSPGILDWDCTDFTYDGHHGHDIDLRSFGEQDVGSPVFAALDGTVADAHDGEFDRNTVWQGQPANYVVLFHGGTHYTWYWHLRSNSVAVSAGQFVRAGTQIGLAASSGNSTGPHLHFESRLNGTWFEPSAGACLDRLEHPHGHEDHGGHGKTVVSGESPECRGHPRHPPLSLDDEDDERERGGIGQRVSGERVGELPVLHPAREHGEAGNLPKSLVLFVRRRERLAEQGSLEGARHDNLQTKSHRARLRLREC